MNILKNKLVIYTILLLIILLALLLRIKPIITMEFPFIFDTGRDLLWTRDIVVLKDFTLIGPWTSLTGVFFGPLWYYLLAAIFIPLGGHPITGTVLSTFLSLATIFLLFFIGKKIKDDFLGLILAFLGAVYTVLINTSVTSLNPNPNLFLSTLVIYLFYKLFNVEKRNFWRCLGLLFFSVSLFFHFSTPTGLYFTMFLFFYLIFSFLKRKRFNFKKFSISSIFFVIPFLPQIVFELRNNFLQIRSFMSFLKGDINSLQGYMGLTKRTLNRWGIISGFYKDLIPYGQNVLIQLFFAAVVFYSFYLVLRNKEKIKNLYWINFAIIGSTFFVFNFLFKAALRPWYLFHIPMVFLVMVGVSLRVLFRKKMVATILIPMLLVSFLYEANIENSLNFEKTTPDISEYRSQKKVIDYIYQDAGETPFNVYVFSPALYDFHYQYSFWWEGRKKNFWPVEYAYLPGKTAYVPNKERYYQRQREIMGDKEAEMTYLIIEDKSSPTFSGWYDYFQDYDLKNVKKFTSGLVVEKRVE
jgi:hypothetical protein